jgi:glycosyltransferase involved in cell wall biosynthesis
MYGDGVYLKRVQKFIKSNNLGDRVTAHGPVSQDIILHEMAQHQLLAYTSYNFDNQPMVLIEAIATGLPVVFCDPDLGETIPTKGSVLSDEPSPSAIAASFKKIGERPSSVKAMSKVMLGSRDTIMQSAQIKKLILVYEDTIQNYKT